MIAAGSRATIGPLCMESMPCYVLAWSMRKWCIPNLFGALPRQAPTILTEDKPSAGATRDSSRNMLCKSW